MLPSLRVSLLVLVAACAACSDDASSSDGQGGRAGSADQPVAGAAGQSGAGQGGQSNQAGAGPGGGDSQAGQSGQGGQSGGAGQAGQGGAPPICAGQPIEPGCCTAGDTCREVKPGCAALPFRCTSVSDGLCGAYAMAYLPETQALGTACPDEGQVCVYEYLASPFFAPDTVSAVVTACHEGQLQVATTLDPAGSCFEGDACTGDGYCSIGFDCCRRYCVCVDGAMACATECGEEGSGGACGGE